MQSPASSAPAVLVIDDCAALLHSFESVLEAYGIPITTARNGHDVLAVFRWVSPAVVLTDIIMPEHDGTSTIMAMRCVPGYEDYRDVWWRPDWQI